MSLKVVSRSFQQVRGMIRPPKNLPYRGIFRKDGEVVRKDELLVNQFKMNYHPGLNVYYENDRGERLLRAHCDGVVRITREKCDVDFEIEEMKAYEYRRDVDLYKMTFNVIPLEPSKNHTLRHEI
ncbi:hypothetical protein L5515_013584 [Caenorhabditis briggsae]|uniref:Uncharacterized protein n=1 Tax=Caenorhabditis briggsae TaxID=6238 RepID=A0AAE9E6S2_CAEBR|nr:hypothetical protein L3Y34_017445 [Caenorhabditis briggsae]UMM16672.1 hypothetical protein L5515_013584 [Caenorhabditis briggsae]